MGRLGGFKYKEIANRLSHFGFVFFREAKGSHEIWYSKSSNRYTTLPKHRGDMPEGTVRAILKQADIDPDDFLSVK